MKVNRLLEIVFILLSKNSVTAKELADKFEVTSRTIYRDIEDLCCAGIPIITNKGSGGGIGIAEGFEFKKTILSENEQKELLLMLNSQKVTNNFANEKILNKLKSIFKGEGQNYIEVDFSDWKSSCKEQDKFNNIKQAIINKNHITFSYYNSSGTESKRTAQPLKLVFKYNAWYLYAFCLLRQEYRFFKIGRIAKFKIDDTVFDRVCTEENIAKNLNWNDELVNLEFKVEPDLAYRIYEDFTEENIFKGEDGYIYVKTVCPKDDWIINYILSYGNKAEVLNPLKIREEIKDRVLKMQKIYF